MTGRPLGRGPDGQQRRRRPAPRRAAAASGTARAAATTAAGRRPRPARRHSAMAKDDQRRPAERGVGRERRVGLGEGEPAPGEAAERHGVARPASSADPQAGHPQRPARAAVSTAGSSAPVSARKAASSRATSSQASGPMTVSQRQQRHEEGQTEDQADQRAPAGRLAAAEQHEQRRCRPARAATQSYGGNASDQGTADAAPASRGPSPRGRSATRRRRARSRASRPGAVLVTVLRIRPGRRGPHRRGPRGRRRRRRRRPGCDGTTRERSRGADCRRRGVRGPGPETGQGPDRPSDRPRPAGCRIERRCLLGGRALPVSHPPGSPSPGRRRRSDLAPGRRLRIAPSLARRRHVTVAEGVRGGCPVMDDAHPGGPGACCQLPADLR